MSHPSSPPRGSRECRGNCRPFLLHFRPKGSLCRTSARTAFCIFRAGITSCLFAVCICTCEGNEGLQREHLFAAGFPIGARSIPVGTRFCSAKSSVLYLCFRLTLERGWLRHLLRGQIAGDSHFSAAVGQADFVRPRTKSGFAPKGKSVCQEKEAKVYHPSSSRSDNALIPPRQLQPEIVQRQCFS